jgi:nicotinamidase-related amidase
LSGKSVLLIYDMAEGMVANESWVSEAMPMLAKLVQHCRLARIPVVYAMGAASIRAGDPVCTAVAPLENERTFTHPESGVFVGTDFDEFLTQQGRDTLLVTGMAVDRGCNTTARDALNRGFHPIMLRDLCFTRDIADSPVGPVSKHDIARIHLASLHRMGIGISTSAEVLTSLG